AIRGGTLETCAACSIVLQNCSIGAGCACTRQVRTPTGTAGPPQRMAEGTSPTTRVGAEAPGSQPATIVAGLAVLLIALVLAGSTGGAYPLALADMLAALGRRLTGAAPVGQIDTVLFEVRLPRVLAAVVVGAAIAGAGAAYQTLFRN